MKTQPDNYRSETFEDIVFEGRNKAYGAYDMNRKRGRYMVIAFLVSFAGFSTAVAVPFINYMKNKVPKVVTFTSDPFEIGKVDPNNTEVLPPPKPPVIEITQKQSGFYRPVIVENPDDFSNFTLEIIENGAVNPPVDNLIPVIPDATPYIEDPDVDKVELFPQEQARFMGGDLESFRNWIMENISYTNDAINSNISGKVIIEFCVNSKGEVVDVKVLRNLYPDLDNAAVKVISGSPLWTPAKQGGRPVKQRFVIPITFKMIS